MVFKFGFRLFFLVFSYTTILRIITVKYLSVKMGIFFIHHSIMVLSVYFQCIVSALSVELFYQADEW